MRTLFPRILVCVLTLLLLSAPSRVMACAVCYGESDAPMAKGAALAIIMLGIVIYGVLGAVIVFFVHSRRKAAAQMASNGMSEPVQSNV